MQGCLETCCQTLASLMINILVLSLMVLILVHSLMMQIFFVSLMVLTTVLCLMVQIISESHDFDVVLIFIQG